MTPDIVAELHPARLPADFVTLGWPDLGAAFGIGLILAGVTLTLLRPLLRPRPQPMRTEDRISDAAKLPPPDRLFALATLLAERGAPLPDGLRHALYAGTAFDPAQVEALIRAVPGRSHG